MDSNSVSAVSLDGASLVAQMVKNLPAVQETWLWSLRQEASMEKGMATHSSILTWRIPWTEEADRLESVELQRIRHDWVSNVFTFSMSLKEAEIRTQIHTEEGACEDWGRRWLTTSQGETPSGETNLLTPWSWTSSLQDCGEMNFCCLSHPDSATLLWQP